jgi:hypothetical protein
VLPKRIGKNKEHQIKSKKKQTINITTIHSERKMQYFKIFTTLPKIYKILQAYMRKMCVNKTLKIKYHTNEFQYQYYIHARSRIRDFLIIMPIVKTFYFVSQVSMKS